MRFLSWSLFFFFTGAILALTKATWWLWVAGAGLVGVLVSLGAYLVGSITGRIDPFPISSPVALRIQITLPFEGERAQGEGANLADGQQRVPPEARRIQGPTARG